MSLHVYDLVDNAFGANEYFLDSNIDAASVIRVQTASESMALRRFDQEGVFVGAWNAWKKAIPPFA